MNWKYEHCLSTCNCNGIKQIVNFTTLVPYQEVGNKEDYIMMDKVTNSLKCLGFDYIMGCMIGSHFDIPKSKIESILIKSNQKLI